MPDATGAPAGPRGRREKLLAAGLALLDEMAPEEITVSAVGERAGVARGLVFYYFESKEGFEQAVAERFYAMVRAALEAGGATDPATAVAGDIAVVLDLAEAHPGAMRATSSPRSAPVETAAAWSLNDFATTRLLRILGVQGPAPALAAVIAGWTLHTVDLALRRSEVPALTRADVEAVAMAEFVAAVTAVAAAHPEYGLDPAVLGG